MANYILRHTGEQIDAGIDKAAGRNLVDNADFQIWTRGESVTVADDVAGMCADRYQIANTSGVTATMAKDTMQVDGVARACGRVSLSAAVATYASGKYVIPFMHVFEGRSVYRYLSPGKSFTVAVAIEVSVAGKYAFAVRNADFSFSYVHTAVLAANTPTIVQFTVPIPTTGDLWNCPNTVARGLDLLIGSVGGWQCAAPSTDEWLYGDYYTTADCINWTATTNATIKITRVRLEEGTVLGAYQAKTYEEDKARCAYFYREMVVSVRQYAAVAGATTICPITWPDMRVAPTWVLGSIVAAANAGVFMVASHDASSGYVSLQSITAGDSYTTGVVKSSGAEL